MLLSPKLAIVQSLDSMDKKQTDEVLRYIREIVTQPVPPTDYQTFKREALNEIRQALSKDKRGLQLTV